MEYFILRFCLLNPVSGTAAWPPRACPVKLSTGIWPWSLRQFILFYCSYQLQAAKIPCPIFWGNRKFSWAVKSSDCSVELGTYNQSKELSMNKNVIIIFKRCLQHLKQVECDTFTLIFGACVLRFYKHFVNIKFWVQR